MKKRENLPSLSAQNSLWELCVVFAPQMLHLVQLNVVEEVVWSPDMWPVLFRVPFEVSSTEIIQSFQSHLKQIMPTIAYVIQSLVVQNTVIVLQHFNFVL